MPARKLRAAAFALYAILLVASAWMQDDAYITFRTVDNFVHGRGLTWNVDERVQAYTHPLWMLAHAALYAATGEIYYTSLAFQLTLSLAVFYLLLFRLSASVRTGAVVGFLLVSSKSFVEYSTSGLENPLTHLLLLVFAVVLFGPEENLSKKLFLLSFVAALGAVNRPDSLLLYLPALGFLAVRHRSFRHAAAVALGFLPLLLWELFALVYYGFLLPNTAYAKLGIGASRWTLLKLGFSYPLYSLLYDPVTVVLMAGGLWMVMKRRPPGAGLVAAGGGLYLVYVVAIGGDYMGGRLLSAPVLAAAVVLARAGLPVPAGKRLAAAAAVLALLVARSATAPLTGAGAEMKNVGDERLRFYHATGLLNAAFSSRPWPDHFFRWKGVYVRRHGPPVVVDAYVGFLGFYAGPRIHIVDLLGLPDPLLARLPGRLAPGEGVFRPGHVSRPLPAGYLASLRSGENRIADPRLAAYYDKIRRVTRGPLWTRQRWLDVWRFHTGGYRDLVDAWVKAHPEAYGAPPADLRVLFTIDEGAVIEEMPSLIGPEVPR